MRESSLFVSVAECHRIFFSNYQMGTSEYMTIYNHHIRIGNIMKKRMKLVLTVVVCLFAAQVFAENEQKTITVKECVSLALQNNPDIRVFIEDENKSMADFQSVKGADSLNVNLIFTPQVFSRTSQGAVSTLTDGHNYYYPQLNLMGIYPLYHPGNGTRTTIARKAVDIARLQGKKGRNDVVNGVKSLYFALIRAHKTVLLKEQMRKNYENRLASIRVYVQRGDRAVIELSSAEVALSQVTLDLKAAQTLEQDTESELKAQMGLMSDAPDITAAEFPDLPDLKYNLDQIDGLINSYSTDVMIAGIRTDQARLAISAARQQHLPSADLQAGLMMVNTSVDLQRPSSYQDSGKWSRLPYIGMSVTLNLYAGGKIVAATDSAIADYNKALFAQRKQLITTRKDAKNSVRKLKELKEQISIARLNIQNSRTNLTLTQRSFDSGIVNQLVVQNAEVGLLQAEMSLIDAQSDYFKTLANLSNQIGLEEEFLCGTN